MKSEQLQAIRERVNKATSGPWTYDDYYSELHGPDIRTTYDMANVRVDKDDAEFIAHAREDVPALLDEIEALQNGARGLSLLVETRDKEIKRLRGALERIANEQVDFPHREADRALAGEPT